jgi:hypothetical protein
VPPWRRKPTARMLRSSGAAPPAQHFKHDNKMKTYYCGRSGGQISAITTIYLLSATPKISTRRVHNNTAYLEEPVVVAELAVSQDQLL